jgi:hypothetical protein
VALDRNPSLCASRAVGHRIHPGFAHLQQGVFNGELGATSQEGHFHHGEGFDVYLGEALLEAPDKIQEVLEGQIGMQPSDDVKLGDGFRIPRGGCLPGFFKRHGIAGRIAFFAPKGAQLARRHADIGGIDVAVDVEVGHIAVQLLAHMVGQPSDGQKI